MNFILDWFMGMLAFAVIAAVVFLVYVFITSCGAWAWLVVVIILGGLAFAISVQ